MSLRYVLLVVLSKAEMTGYDISKQFNESVGFFWDTTHQQIYRALGALDREGLVNSREEAQQGKPDKKIYTLAKAGREELDRWLATPTRTPPINSPLLVKFEAGDAANLPALIGELDQKIAASRAKIETYRQIEACHFSGEEPLSVNMRLKYLTLKNGLTYEQYWYDWAVAAKEELEEIEEDRGPSA